MARLAMLFLACLLVSPDTAHAIQLHWAGGSTDLAVSQNTQAVLVVLADSAEVTLPGNWQLEWTADSSGVRFSAFDPNEACLVDTAKVDSVLPPSTPADSVENAVTARFCSSGAQRASVAYFLVDLAAGSHGKMKVVGLNPADTTQVIESNEVTFNGGIGGDYAPILLTASSTHTSLRLQLTAIGSGLQETQGISISAPDMSWRVPLSIVAASDNSITAVASLAALVPSCVVNLVSSGATSSSSVPLAADAAPDTVESGGCISFFREDLLTPAHGLVDEIQPKDFAFVKGFVDTTLHAYMLHLFYTRQNQELVNNHHDELTTKNIGHAVSADFSWSGKPDTTLLPVRPGHFDNDRVWAPSVVLQFPNYFMFYTGVDSLGHQRIGVATSQTLLGDSWVRSDTALFDATKSIWAARGVYLSWVNCRDPFVMQDPDNPNIWLLYYVAVDSASVVAGHPQMAVGVARSYGDMYSWKDSTELVSTLRPIFGKPSTMVESPHVFRHNGQWWMPYTVNQDSVYFEATTQGPVAADAGWDGPVCLRSVVQGHPATQQYFHASEYLKVNQKEYLAAFDDAGMQIDIQEFFPVSPDSVGVDSLNLQCPQGVAAVGGSAPPVRIQLAVSSLARPPGVNMRINLPERERVRLTVYDVLGRRRRTLLDGDLPVGTTRLTWDCRDQEGDHVASGVYFVRLSCPQGTAVQRTVILR